MTSRHLELNDATIGVVTALPKEYAAAKRVLACSTEVSAPGTDAGRSFAVSRISATDGGLHVVAVTLLPDMGNNLAAVCATSLLRHCPNVKHLIMSGIAGAVPDPKNSDRHVRLGDIVVSDRSGVVQYDLTKVAARMSLRENRHLLGAFFGWLAGDRGDIVREVKEHRGPPRPPCPVMLQTVQRLQANAQLNERPWEKTITSFVTNNGKQWSRPGPNLDRLSDWHDGWPTTTHPADEQRHDDRCPRVFLGPIGSANILLKHPQIRDGLRDRFKIKAVEMEGSGIADATWHEGVGYLVVRGTCDYCNKDKGDRWQMHAALIAAAYTRSVIEAMPSTRPHNLVPMLHLPIAPAASWRQELTGGVSFASSKTTHTDDKVIVDRAQTRFEKSNVTPDGGGAIRVPTRASDDSNAKLAEMKASGLIKNITQSLDVFDHADAITLASQLEESLKQDESLLPKGIRVEAYKQLAEVALVEARQDVTDDNEVDTTRAKSFYRKARDVLQG
ncbi:MAG: hypothetical protein H6822_24395 [Planctomycetaceae bacterium]|nr:hypothetical protein [Planctomycetaceae bacterium]